LQRFHIGLRHFLQTLHVVTTNFDALIAQLKW